MVTVATGVRVTGIACANVNADVDGAAGQKVCRGGVQGIWYENVAKSKDAATAAASGAKAGKHLIHARVVIMASGGFAASTKQLQRWNPQLAKLNLPTTNGPWATGDGLDIAEVRICLRCLCS